MLKILEFVEAGEYETAWSLAVATGREIVLFELICEMAENASKREMKAFGYYRNIRDVYSIGKHHENLPYHRCTIGLCERMSFQEGNRIFEKAQNLYNAHSFIKGELKSYEKSNQ